jgi:serine acetyltransferase
MLPEDGVVAGDLRPMFNNFVEYLDSIKSRDPAPRSRWEILLYPGVWALGLHRVATCSCLRGL